MTRAHPYLLSLAAGGTAAGLFVLACGARTGLDAPIDAAVFSFDAGEDAEAEFDATFDVDFDAGFDAGVDSFFPVDVIAPIDVHVAPDSGLACPDGGLPNAYLFDNAGALYTFDPATLATRLLGTPTCAGASEPWTLSVSREGNAYLVFVANWLIYKVDLTTLVCTPTPFVPGQLGLNGDFSIAVSRNAGTEKLFVYGEPGPIDVTPTMPFPNTPPILAQSDLSTFVLSEVGAVVPEPPLDSYPLDMQGDPLGNLFGLSDDGLLVEIDSATGAAIGKADTGFAADGDWAVMSYENQVYLFSGNGTESQVARYDIATQTLDIVGTIGISVVGASAVPCLRAGVVLPSPP